MEEIVDKFNKYFVQVGKNIVDNINDEVQALGHNLAFNEIHSENSCYVEQTQGDSIIISELKRTSAPGHDNVAVQNLLILKGTLVTILVRLINDVLKNGKFPDEINISKITPMLKFGARDLTNNYRPISVISVFSMIVEYLEALISLLSI